MQKQLTILLGNDPQLRKKSLPVQKDELETKKMQDFLDDLENTMRVADGLGLAAPQVNVRKNIMAVRIKGVTTCLINPNIIKKSKEMIKDDEGCLSFPGLFSKITRHQHISVEALDRNGQLIKHDLSDLDARVVQHEHDHLVGILLPDRIAAEEKISAQI